MNKTHNTPLTFEEWHNENADSISIAMAESGADREMDFDLERELEKRYEDYYCGIIELATYTIHNTILH